MPPLVPTIYSILFCLSGRLHQIMHINACCAPCSTIQFYLYLDVFNPWINIRINAFTSLENMLTGVTRYT